MQSTCPVCQSSFTNTTRPKTYCSVDCQSKAANTRTNARRRPAEAVKTPRPALTLVHCEDPSTGQPPPRADGILKPLEIEWFDCSSTRYDQPLHRAVAGRMNRTRGSDSILRSEAIGNDRPPIGHVLLVDGEFVGRVRSGGAVIWSSARQPSLEAAKSAVENHLAGHAEIVADAANLNRPQPMALAA
jgi:hypothetical protein